MIVVSCLFVSSAALAQSTSFSDRDNQLQAVTLQLKWKHQFQFAGYYAALDKGFYRDAGFDVQISEHEGARSPLEVLLDGDAAFAVSGSDIVITRAQGKPVVALATVYQHSPYAFLVRGDSGIERIGDLAGRRIMIGKGFQDAALQATLKRSGLTEDDYQRIPISFNVKYNTQGMSRGRLLYEASASRELIQPLLVDIGYMHPERWEHIRDIFAELGFIDTGSSIDGLVYEEGEKTPEWMRWIDENLVFLVVTAAII
ncbi:ABC transporter substrate-binding protein [Solemya velesiana gill symbiont]|uniref:Thiamine pyrimidine synthase n=1 Tax=Solemya velesiana gill symbiont TaxID=1918948 RepID=A0A1T2KV37_9GAMM|nr:ABC transporter substrate-binding protein [Solemya velesiana gill symbiont]OOZ36723.1 hypothetical protein BOW51_05825 [Solemya velesiana gill symbiont]